MEPVRLTTTPQGLQIEGIPDGTHVVSVVGVLARRLADLQLHATDLSFAAAALDALGRMEPDDSLVREALWRTAIVHYFKCFGEGARFQLSERKLHKGLDPIVHTIFGYFKDLRNKHFVHDENAYAQATVCAVLNNGSKPYKVEKVVCVAALAKTSTADNVGNLGNLVQVALRWVELQHREASRLITEDLEKQSMATLTGAAVPSLRVPLLNEIGKKRHTQ